MTDGTDTWTDDEERDDEDAAVPAIPRANDSEEFVVVRRRRRRLRSRLDPFIWGLAAMLTGTALTLTGLGISWYQERLRPAPPPLYYLLDSQTHRDPALPAGDGATLSAGARRENSLRSQVARARQRRARRLPQALTFLGALLMLGGAATANLGRRRRRRHRRRRRR